MVCGNDGLDISSCVVNADKLIFVDKKNTKLIIYKDDCTYLHDVALSGKPVDIAAIDENNVVVTYGRGGYVEFMNLMTNEKKQVVLGNYCSGITCEGGKVYVVVDNKGIVVMTTTGAITRIIEATKEYDQATYIAVNNDHIYLTVFSPDKLVCLDTNGEFCWQFNQKIISQPRGVTADSHGNIYVANFKSNTVSKIQADGYIGNDILTGVDGLNYSSGIYCDCSRRRLLVCNSKNGYAYLYDIIDNA